MDFKSIISNIKKYIYILFFILKNIRVKYELSHLIDKGSTLMLYICIYLSCYVPSIGLPI